MQEADGFVSLKPTFSIWLLLFGEGCDAHTSGQHLTLHKIHLYTLLLYLYQTSEWKVLSCIIFLKSSSNYKGNNKNAIFKCFFFLIKAFILRVIHSFITNFHNGLKKLHSSVKDWVKKQNKTM